MYLFSVLENIAFELWRILSAKINLNLKEKKNKDNILYLFEEKSMCNPNCEILCQ